LGVLIDATVFIDHERGTLDLARHIATRQEETFFLSVITVAELLAGVYRARTPAQKAKRSVFVEGIIDRLPLLPIDLPSARVRAEISAGLTASGKIIGANDLWLAAAALAHGLTLVTSNLREFGRVPGLVLEHWKAEEPR
jgi:predicted nucleic acid-binding protein